MTIPQADFDNIWQWTPLVSIDLIVVDPKGRVLLGRRVNEPAKGSWFVPGGRIRKDESLSEAYRRIVASELGDTAPVSTRREDAQLLGAFDHLYPASEHATTNTSIHYVVLGHCVQAPAFDPARLPKEQHSEWRWFAVDELLSSDDVHPNTKGFFMDTPRIAPEQYEIVAQRQLSHDNLLWQTPVLSLTAQAFLFTIAFSDLPATGRLPASLLIMLVSGASLQLMAKHRAYEIYSSKLLEDYEKHSAGFKVVHIQLPREEQNWWTRFSSYLAWIILLWCFFVAGGFAVISCGSELWRKCDSQRDADQFLSPNSPTAVDPVPPRDVLDQCSSVPQMP